MLSLLSGVSRAGQETGFRNITSVGCHRSDGTCFIIVDGSGFYGGGATCSEIRNEVRFSTEDANGKRNYMTLLSAYMVGKKVSFYVNGCYVNQPAFQTFDWYFLQN